MFESTGLIGSTPSGIRWTVSTGAPTRAERLAALSFSRYQSRQPWWLPAVGWSAYAVFGVLRTWPNEWAVSLYLFIGISWWIHGWSRQGFLDLIERYDAELRNRQESGGA
jgi:hypothetical protein